MALQSALISVFLSLGRGDAAVKRYAFFGLVGFCGLCYIFTGDQLVDFDLRGWVRRGRSCLNLEYGG